MKCPSCHSTDTRPHISEDIMSSVSANVLKTFKVLAVTYFCAGCDFIENISVKRSVGASCPNFLDLKKRWGIE